MGKLGDMVPLAGRGLHTGKPAQVAFFSSQGEVTIDWCGRVRNLSDATKTGVFASSTLVWGKDTLQTVEHLLGALAGLGIWRDLRVAVEGDELPLLGGSAAAYVAALEPLGIASAAPELVVMREALYEIDGSRYRFRPQSTVTVEVEVELPSFCETRARWDGDAIDFATRIAPARTFALERDLERFGAEGLAQHASADAFVVVTSSGLVGQHVIPDEPARHKLLDLLGDAYGYGGPPRGYLNVFRPGHTRNHEAMRRAIADGVVA